MVALMTGMLCGAIPVSAQTRKVQNRPYIDLRAWHYGFLFGLHVQDLEFTHNGYLNMLDDGTAEAWFADVPSYSPGFNVGVLGEARFTNELSLRIIPTMYFGDKTVIFYEQNTGFTTQQTIKSTYFTVPVDMKWSAPRFNNYRPYLLAGISPMINLSGKDQDFVHLKRFDAMVEVGFGCDYYLPFFKLIPELKFCFSLPDVFDKTHADELTDANKLAFARSVNVAQSKMIVLTFYFE